MARTTDWDRREMLLTRIKDIYSSARQFGTHSDSLRKRLRDIVWNDPQYQRLPQYHKQYLNGYERCLHDNLWHSLTLQQFSTVDYQWHNSMEMPMSEWSRLFSDQCSNYNRADTSRFGIGEYYASNAGMPTRHIYPNGRVYNGDSVVE